MKRERYFEATEFQNIKEIIYNSAKVYAENVAFVIKHKDDNFSYELGKQLAYSRAINELMERILQD